MTKYIFTYHGGSGMAATPEEQERQMAAWGSWMGEIEASLADGGNPFGRHVTVGADGATSDGGPAAELGGYSIVTADSMEAACDLAKGCPVLNEGGSVQVSEAIDV